MQAFRPQGSRTIVIEPKISQIVPPQEEPTSTDQAPNQTKESTRKQEPTISKKKTKRIGRSMYVATANQGSLGIIDKHQNISGHSMLLLHVPKKYNFNVLNMHVGDVLETQGLHNTAETYDLIVTFVGRSKYFAPGKRVSSCVVGVDAVAWDTFKNKFIK